MKKLDKDASPGVMHAIHELDFKATHCEDMVPYEWKGF